MLYLCAAGSGNLGEVDGDDLCEVDNSELVIAHSQLSQLLLGFSKASHAAKKFFILAGSLLKVRLELFVTSTRKTTDL